MDMIISHPVAGAAPTTQGNPAHGRRTGRSAAARPRATGIASTAVDWRLLLRPYLDETHDLLLSATHPVEGPMPLGLPTELATHSVVALRELLSAEDDSSVWEDGTTTLCALQWARHSMLAAVALLGTGDDESHQAAGTYRAVSQRLAAACTALELTHDPAAMNHELQRHSAQPASHQPAAFIRSAPARALDSYEIEAFADQAARAGSLVTWCVSAHAILGSISQFADVDADFRASLSRVGIAYRNADWQRCRMDEGLADVLQQQERLIRRVAGGAAA